MSTIQSLVQRTTALNARLFSWALTHPFLTRLVVFSFGVLMSEAACADGAIPTPASGDDPTKSGDFITVLKNIIKSEVGPVLIYGGAVFLVVMAVFDMYRGYKKYQDTDDFGKFKMSLVAGGLMIVVGLVLMFLGQHILTAWT